MSAEYPAKYLRNILGFLVAHISFEVADFD